MNEVKDLPEFCLGHEILRCAQNDISRETRYQFFILNIPQNRPFQKNLKDHSSTRLHLIALW